VKSVETRKISPERTGAKSGSKKFWIGAVVSRCLSRSSISAFFAIVVALAALTAGPSGGTETQISAPVSTDSLIWD
jgi:hypothetical protein